MSYSYRNNGDDDLPGTQPDAIWKRGLIALLFMLLFSLAQTVLYAVAIIQFLWMLIREERNTLLAQFGYSLSVWLAETARFLSGDIDEKPFPWKPWPEA